MVAPWISRMLPWFVVLSAVLVLVLVAVVPRLT